MVKFAKSLIFLPILAIFAFGTPIQPRQSATFDNMLVILLENTDYSDAVADPNLQAFASTGILYTNWKAISHPSEPNYIAMITGDTQGITDDKEYTLNVQSVVDLLEAKSLTWKAYQENWPGNCFTGMVSSDNLYYRSGLVVLTHLSWLIVVPTSESTTLSSPLRISSRTRRVAAISSMLLSSRPTFPMTYSRISRFIP